MAFEVEIKDKVAWVTGASRGIGREIALGLAKSGCAVAVGYRSRREEAEKVVAEVSKLGGKALAVQLDVSNRGSCEKAYGEIAEELGRVDILVNNAGVIADNLFLMLEDEDWQSVIETNLMGLVHTTRLCARDMMMRRWGRVINLSSIAATKGGRGQSNYAASKGAVEALSRSLAVELGGRGITVNCIAPGVIETEMSSEVVKLAKDEILARQVIKRLGKPEEIAAWAVFLASDFAGFMTGQVVAIDGGMKMP